MPGQTFTLNFGWIDERCRHFLKNVEKVQKMGICFGFCFLREKIFPDSPVMCSIYWIKTGGKIAVNELLTREDEQKNIGGNHFNG